MKNKLFYTLFIAAILNFFTVVSLHSQITLGTNHLPVIGDHITQKLCDTTGITQGSSGANQTWNFSNLNVGSDSIVFSYVNPSGTPFYSHFPTAHLAGETSVISYSYFTVSGGDQNAIGMGFGTAPFQVISTYSDPQLVFRVPFTYNSTYTDNFNGTISSSTQNMNTRGTITNTADAYGTIILPGSTYNNVLRIHSHQDITDSLLGVPVPVVTRTVTDNYSWYSSQYKFSVFSIIITTDHKSADQTITKSAVITTLNTSVGVTPIGNQVVSEYKLHQNYPNPFNPVTTITFDILKTSNVKLVVYDALGREVSELVNESLSNGSYKVDFFEYNLTSGVYFYKLTAGDYSETKIMVLIK